MKEEIVLKPGYDPDKYRNELCENSWIKSGAKTLEEYVLYIKEKHKKFAENRKALIENGKVKRNIHH